jgi:hypothetical protein
MPSQAGLLQHQERDDASRKFVKLHCCMSEQKAVPAVGFEDKYYVLLKIEFQDFDQVFK